MWLKSQASYSVHAPRGMFCAGPMGEGRGGGGGGGGGEGQGGGEAGQHLLLELAELGREAVDADAGLLQLLVGSPHQVLFLR